MQNETKTSNSNYLCFTKHSTSSSISYTILRSIDLFDTTLKGLSHPARSAYHKLLKRTSLSLKNEWFDEEGRVYVICTIDELCTLLSCSKNTAESCLKELCEAGLLTKVRRGLGRPNLLYVRFLLEEKANSVPDEVVSSNESDNSAIPFYCDNCSCADDVATDDTVPLSADKNPDYSRPLLIKMESFSEEPSNVAAQEFCNEESRRSDNGAPESQKLESSYNRPLVIRDCSNNMYNSFYHSENNLISNGYEMNEPISYQEVYEFFRKNMSWDDEVCSYCHDLRMQGKEFLIRSFRDEMEFILRTMCDYYFTGKEVSVKGTQFLKDQVRSRLLKVDFEEVVFIRNYIASASHRIHNIGNYIMASLFSNAGMSSIYWGNMVSVDYHAS